MAKSYADRAGGNFKSFLRNLVKAGQASISCEDIEISRSKYEKQGCCTEHKEEHSLRIVFCHPEIPREGKLPKLKRVIDSQKNPFNQEHRNRRSIRNKTHVLLLLWMFSQWPLPVF